MNTQMHIGPMTTVAAVWSGAWIGYGPLIHTRTLPEPRETAFWAVWLGVGVFMLVVSMVFDHFTARKAR